jgi:uncharacterized protein
LLGRAAPRNGVVAVRVSLGAAVEQWPFRRRRATVGDQVKAAGAAEARSRERAVMAMTMSGEYELPVPRETVWEKLNDAETLKACIPGAEQLDKLSDTELQAVVTTKIGPVKAKFKGKVTLSDLDPPNGYKISGEGEGGVAGFAKGGASVALSPKDGGTLLTYNVEAQIGGKLAQLGQRLVAGASKKMADEFFEKFAGVVNQPS